METIPAKTILQKNKSTDWFGSEYNINLYRGCCHGCIYCDSRSDCYRVSDFENIHVKENCLQILRDELRSKVRTGIVGTGAMSDPYNSFEETELVTRHSFELIDAFGFGAAVLTKSPLIRRDIDIFQSIAEHSPMLCQVTVTAAEDGLSRLVEPGVAPTSERLEALAEMSEGGLFTGVVMTPILPFIEDTEENVLKIVRLAKEAGARSVYPMFGLTMRDGQREFFYSRLEEIFPGEGLAEKYRNTYGNRYVCMSPSANRLWKAFTAECDRLGLIYDMRGIISAYKLGYDGEQLTFL